MARVPTLAVFTKNRINPAYAAARLAADRVAAEAGARTIHYVPETPDDVGQQKALVGEALAARVDAVVLNPTDDVKMQEDLARLAEAGIPVALFINRMSGPGADLRRLRRRRHRPAGGDGLVRGHGRQGQGRRPRRPAVGADQPRPGEGPQAKRCSAFRESSCWASRSATCSRRRPRTRWPDCWPSTRVIDGVWTANDLMAFGALDALQAAGRTAKVVGINGLPAAIEHIERGTMVASADFSAFNIAAIAARAVLRHLAGQPVPKEIMVPAELIDRSNCQRWKVPFAERACPAWEEIVR